MAISTELFDLSGQVALVTGGASGIGLAIAEAFVMHGGKVVVGSRTVEKVDHAVKVLNQLREPSDGGVNAVGVGLDVTCGDSVDRAVSACIDHFGGLHILVNSAGNMIKKPTFDLTADEFDSVHATHVTGALRCSQAAGHVFREQHQGCIINIASVTSFMDLTEVTAYSVAKNGVLGLTRSLANEWAKYGIRTNGIAPGFIPTEINKKMIVGTDRGRRILERTPMARFGTGDEIGGAAVYLASKAGSFVNGETIKVDGGFMCVGLGDGFADWALPDGE